MRATARWRGGGIQAFHPLMAEQAGRDQRFIVLLDAADDADLDRIASLPRGDHLQREPLGHVVAHVLDHQVHHRGQAHTKMSATAADPAQLDEILMRSEAHLRSTNMAALGWQEGDLFRSA